MKIVICCSEPLEISIVCSQIKKKQYFLSLQHQKSIFSLLRPPRNISLFPNHQRSILSVQSHQKSILSVPRPSKINNFLSPDPQTSVFSMPRPLKFIICCPQSVFITWSLNHHWSALWTPRKAPPSDLAGTQVCYALDIGFQGFLLVFLSKNEIPLGIAWFLVRFKIIDKDEWASRTDSENLI